MDKKRILITSLAIAVLGTLVYLQIRHWKSFDWATFWEQSSHVRPWHLFHAVALIYLADAVRAVRWKIFLRPTRPKASITRLLSPTYIGFAGLALLGRPGEFIRPYMIAKREDLTISSQIGVWLVERIFDIGGFAVLMVYAIFSPWAKRDFPHPEYYERFRDGGLGVMGIVLLLAIAAVIINARGPHIADWLEKQFSHRGAAVSHRIAQKMRDFAAGLHTIHGWGSLLQLIALSIGIWWLIAVAYHEVTISYHQTAHVFGEDPLDIPLLQVLLLMGSSMVGSVVQLPGVGGGSQLATIATLDRVFDVPQELAVSCGMMLWLVTFFSVVPLGLYLAHREHLSLRKISQESHARPEDQPALKGGN
jgi:uncharacterized protein (TIRG00374 family)